MIKINKKGDGINLSFTTIVGLVVGIIILLVVFSIGNQYTKTLLKTNENNRLLENSMNLLKEEILKLENGEFTDVNIRSVERDVFLSVFNKDEHNIKECFNAACIAICSDNDCKNYFFPKDIENTNFSTTGKIVSLKSDRDIPLFLKITKADNLVSIEHIQK